MIGTIARIAVGVAFVVAGATKLAAGRAWPEQARGLGVDGRVAAVLPWIELVLGATTVVGVVEPWPIGACAVLLAAFTVVIAARLRRGEHPPCACFGAWSARPIGGGHLARNATLLALAVVGAVG